MIKPQKLPRALSIFKTGFTAGELYLPYSQLNLAQNLAQNWSGYSKICGAGYSASV
jgi:hypothetical protein